MSHFQVGVERFDFDAFFEITLPKTNIAPENWWLEDVFPIGNAYFQGQC